MTNYVKCRLCGELFPLTVEKPRFTIKENGIKDAVCSECFKKLINCFRKK